MKHDEEKVNMKKLITLLLVFVMTVGMASTVLAAPSPSSSTDTVPPAIDDTGKKVDIITSDPEPEIKKEIPSVTPEGYDVIWVKKITTPDNPAYPITVTVNVNGVKKGTKVVVKLYVDGEWKEVTAVAGDGKITITLNQTGTIAIFVESDAKVSPKTGEAPITAGLVGLAAIAAAGIYFTSRKKKA